MWVSGDIPSQPLPVPLALSSSTEQNVNKGRILIVDDDPDITKTFGLVLEDSGLYEVDTYNDALVALQNFKPNFYDLAILDIRMPNMNGFELSYKIENIDNKVKVCFTSAYDMEEKALRKQFPSIQMKSFLPKPIAVSDLIKKVETELLR
jgi:two-component system, OmpR family, response regulator ChvI